MPARGIVANTLYVVRMRPPAALDAVARRNLYDRAAAIPFGAGHAPVKSLNTE